MASRDAEHSELVVLLAFIVSEVHGGLDFAVSTAADESGNLLQ